MRGSVSRFFVPSFPFFRAKQSVLVTLKFEFVSLLPEVTRCTWPGIHAGKFALSPWRYSARMAPRKNNARILWFRRCRDNAFVGLALTVSSRAFHVHTVKKRKHLERSENLPCKFHNNAKNFAPVLAQTILSIHMAFVGNFENHVNSYESWAWQFFLRVEEMEETRREEFLCTDEHRNFSYKRTNIFHRQPLLTLFSNVTSLANYRHIRADIADSWQLTADLSSQRFSLFFFYWRWNDTSCLC